MQSDMYLQPDMLLNALCGQAGTICLPSIYISICLSIRPLKSGSQDKQANLVYVNMWKCADYACHFFDVA